MILLIKPLTNPHNYAIFQVLPIAVLYFTKTVPILLSFIEISTSFIELKHERLYLAYYRRSFKQKKETAKTPNVENYQRFPQTKYLLGRFKRLPERTNRSMFILFVYSYFKYNSSLLSLDFPPKSKLL